jgi:hypothetical protein
MKILRSHTFLRTWKELTLRVLYMLFIYLFIYLWLWFIYLFIYLLTYLFVFCLLFIIIYLFIIYLFIFINVILCIIYFIYLFIYWLMNNILFSFFELKYNHAVILFLNWFVSLYALILVLIILNRRKEE